MSTATMTPSPLATVVDALFADIFFQPDDAVSTTAFARGFADDAVIRINGQPFTPTAYSSLITTSRHTQTFRAVSSEELAFAPAPTPSPSSGVVVGTVAQRGVFGVREKKQGEEGKEEMRTAVMIVTVAEREGRGVVVELTEVMA